MSNIESKRDETLDLVKGLGVLLVCLGHTLYARSVPFRLVFFVHMPLFFLMSGMLFDPARYRSIDALGTRVEMVKYGHGNEG